MKVKFRLFLLVMLPIAVILTGCNAKTSNRQSGPSSTVLKECPKVGPPGSSWERYEPNSFSNLLKRADETSYSPDVPEPSIYLETSSDYQLSSCVQMEYTGNYREITSTRKKLIEVWGGTVGNAAAGQQVNQMLQHEVMFIENGQEYWLVVQEPLIPYMRSELTVNEPVIVYVLWMGSIHSDNMADHIFLIGEFTK